MHTIYIGFCISVSPLELAYYFNGFEADSGLLLSFSRDYGIPTLPPGSSELYGQEYAPSGFTHQRLDLLMPFAVAQDLRLFSHDLSLASAVFYFTTEELIDVRANPELQITDVLQIERFDFE